MAKMNSYRGLNVVFANEDDGIFSAIPVTLDSEVYDLETEVVGTRTFVKAGSVVKDKGTTVVRGILPEEYEITNGPAAGRVALEGYAYASRLTPAALTAASALPKIVVMPYKATIVQPGTLSTDGETWTISLEGNKFATTAAADDFTVSGNTVTAVAVSDDQNSIALTLGTAIVDGTPATSITAIDASALAGPAGTTVKGLPLSAADAVIGG